jgi:asparagine synthase (glutamine-hydrolysing)
VVPPGFCVHLFVNFITNIFFLFAIAKQNAARSTVPGGPSVACSTAKAVEWDAAWSKNPDPSGRAALGIHEAAYEEEVDAKDPNLINGSAQKL